MTTTTTTTAAVPASAASTQPASARMLARIAAGAAAAATAAIVLAGFLDRGYSSLSEAISALASQESTAAPVMIAGFLAMAVTLLAAGATLFQMLPSKRAKVGSVLVILVGLLTVVVGFARQSCSSLQAECLARESAGTVSASHWVHNLVSLPIFLLLGVAAYVWGAGLTRSTGSKSLARLSLIVAIATTLSIVWFGSGAYGSFGGVVERVLVLLAFGWPAYLAIKVTQPRTSVN